MLVKHGSWIKIFFVLVLLTSCWQEQHHNIIPPTLPNYSVMGKVLSSADDFPVEGAVVFIGPETETIALDTTDSTGSFCLDHIQGGKEYALTVTKQYYQPTVQYLAVSYDTIEVDDIYLGKIYYHHSLFNSGLWSSFTPQGLVWIGENLWSVDSSKSLIIVHNYDSHMSVKKTYNMPRYPIPHREDFSLAPLGLELFGNSLLTYDNRKFRIYALTPTAGDTVLLQTSYNVQNEEVPTLGDLWDLAWDGEYLWACSPGSYSFSPYLRDENSGDDVLVRFDHDMSVEEVYPTSDIDTGIIDPTGIAWDGDKFWLNSRGTYRLYTLDKALNVLGFYVYELCWGNGYLWGCFRDSWGTIYLGGKPSQYIYQFGMLYP